MQPIVDRKRSITPYCVVLFCLLFCDTYAQQLGFTAEDIKARPDEYLYGEGTGRTQKKADEDALEMLISQISISVSSEFNWLVTEKSKNDKDFESEEFCESIINTYSNATLNNTQIMSWGDVPNITVFRYVKKSEVSKLFEQRKGKIMDYARIGREAELDNNIADALRYYYWSLILLQSHPEGNAIYYDELNKEKKEVIASHLLYSYLPLRINKILNGVKVAVTSVNSVGNLHSFNIDITNNNKRVSSCDYSYFAGNTWSSPIGSKDGLGVIELVGNEVPSSDIDIRVEYQFEDKMNIDPEVASIYNIEVMSPPIFKNSKCKVSLAKKDFEESTKTFSQNEEMAQTNSLQLAPVVDTNPYASVVERVKSAINSKNYASVASEFTTEGYAIYKKLITYGNAKCLVDNVDYQFLMCNDEMICRALPMRFQFVNNRRVFVENVVFHFNAEQKIKNVSFALDANTFNEIFANDEWDAYVSWVIVDFMENYQTAYALERIDYLNSIFDDNALIIVGSVLKRAEQTDKFSFSLNDKVQRTRVSKTQYISNLRNVFNNNEYINIKLVDVSIKKARRGSSLFGIQVCQDYYSTNYGDKGYLFFLVDLTEREKPNILVRTWQGEPDPDFGVVDLSHF